MVLIVGSFDRVGLGWVLETSAHGVALAADRNQAGVYARIAIAAGRLR
ncbi:MAG TPA: hypothetical protein VMU55_08340 [Solirubrobacteraceae bacterium]|nr:hypothetical protein [Solirubrobacteraceae bacterium]